MSRVSSSQRQRTQKNPLVLGPFSQTALRELTGTLGPLNQVVGRADTNQYSNGGYGGGTYNHWFQINVTASCWIITKKGGPRPNHIQVSAYDLNLTPIQGRMIFQGDSASDYFGLSTQHYPYNDHVMGAASDLYNTSNPNSIGKGSDLYFPLEQGNYLICVSSTRNELLNYTLALVVEFSTTEMFLLLEDSDGSFLTTETTIDLENTIVIGPLFNSNYTIPTGSNAYTFLSAAVDPGFSVTVPEGSTWLIGTLTVAGGDLFIIEPSPTYDYDSVHEHSRSEWLTAWRRERSPEDSLPAIFDSLITNV